MSAEMVDGRETVGAISLLNDRGRVEVDLEGSDVKVISGMVERSRVKVGKARVADLFSE